MMEIKSISSMFVVVDDMKKELNQEQLDRYYCSIKLNEIGEQGQLKLLNSKVLVVGAGGLASSTLMYLSSSGVGYIGIIDNDNVASNNLPRQILYNSSDIGKKKVEMAKKRLRSLNKDAKAKVYDELLNIDNASKIIKGYDLIIDCVDNFETKFLINDTCVKLHKPFITGGVSDYRGQVMTYIPEKLKDFKSLFSELPVNIDEKYKDDDGVFPPAVAIISNIQASEALKYLLGIGELLTNQMLVVDTLNWHFQKIKIN